MFLTQRSPDRQFRLPTALLGLALVLLVPALGLGAAATWIAGQANRDAFESRLRDTARALALAADREIGTHLAALNALAVSSALNDFDPALEAFEREARRAAEGLGTSIILLEYRSLRQIINTALPYGTPAGAISAGDFRAAALTGRPLVTDLVIGAVARVPVVGVAVPVERDGSIPFVLAARLPLGRLTALLAAQASSGREWGFIVDSRHQVVARSRDQDRYVGRPSPAWFTQGSTGRSAGFLRGQAIGGEDVAVGFAQLGSAPGWAVGIAEPWNAYTSTWLRPFGLLLIGGGLIVGLGAAFAIWLSQRMLRTMEGLVHDAQAFVADTGEALPTPTAKASPVAEFEALRLGLVAANVALRARAIAKREADSRQTLLVREVDHRAKNALAVALSVIRLTPRDVAPERFAAAVEGRVASMARAHSLLAKEAWNGADLRSVAADELAPYADRIRLESASTYLAAPAVQPMAMVLHELATNAAKYGALSVPEGRVRLSWNLNAEDDTLRLVWAENGGPSMMDVPVKRAFGTRLIVQLAERQLSGKVHFNWRPEGLRFSLTLPARWAQPKPGRVEAPAPPPLRKQKTAEPRPEPASPRRVLVVEDEVLLSMELEAALRELGYEVVGPARNLSEALILAVNENDLFAAVLDVNLGGRERSFPVADLLQTRDVPYIFVTGYGSTTALTGRDTGATIVLHKPYAQHALANALRAAVRDPEIATAI